MQRYVQTEVDEKIHEDLLALSLVTGTPVKQIVLNAIIEYIKKHKEQIKNAKKDPAWGLVGFLEIGGNFSMRSREWRVAKLKRNREKEFNIENLEEDT